MPDKKSSDKEQDKEGGKKSLLPIVVIGVVMLGGGYFVGGMMSGGSEPVPVADAAEAEPEAEKVELGHLEALEAVNVNLADGHFLRIAVTLEIHSDEKEASGGHGGEEAAAFATAPAADLVLTTFSGQSMEELSTVEGRESAREHLLEKVIEKYGETVTSLYFTEFVMQ